MKTTINLTTVQDTVLNKSLHNFTDTIPINIKLQSDNDLKLSTCKFELKLFHINNVLPIWTIKSEIDVDKLYYYLVDLRNLVARINLTAAEILNKYAELNMQAPDTKFEVPYKFSIEVKTDPDNAQLIRLVEAGVFYLTS